MAREGVTHTRELGAVAMRVWEYAAAELAFAWQNHPLAAQELMADALDLASRMPVAWTSVLDGDLQALRVAFKLGFVEAQRFQEYGAEQWLGVWRSPVSFNARI